MKSPFLKKFLKALRVIAVGAAMCMGTLLIYSAADKGVSADFIGPALGISAGIVAASVAVTAIVCSIAAAKTSAGSMDKELTLSKRIIKQQDKELVQKGVDLSKTDNQIKVNEATVQEGNKVKDAISEALALGTSDALKGALVKSNAYITVTTKCLDKSNDVLENVKNDVNNVVNELGK